MYQLFTVLLLLLRFLCISLAQINALRNKRAPMRSSTQIGLPTSKNFGSILHVHHLMTDSGPSSSSPPAKGGAIRTVLKFTGIPESWIRRPKLPSRNWLIFLGVTNTLIGCYYYDRYKCKKIREEYVRRVEHFATEPMGSMELPRKVQVYSCKWPGDEDHDKGLKYFKKYVKVRVPGLSSLMSSKPIAAHSCGSRCRLRRAEWESTRLSHQHSRRPDKDSATNCSWY